MKFGLCSFSYRWSIGRPYYRPADPMTVEEFLNKTASFGLKDAMLCNNTEWNFMSDERLKEIRTLSDSLGIRLNLGLRETEPEAYFEAFRKAEILGASVMRIVYDLERKEDPEEDAKELGKLIDCLGKLLPEAEKHGLTLAMENGPFLPAEDIVAIINRFNCKNLGACIDSMNCVYGLQRPEEAFGQMAPYAKMVHLKDFAIEPNKRGYIIRGLPLGDGCIKWDGILKYLRDAGYQGEAYLELYIDRKEEEKETFEYEEEAVSRSVAYAKKLGLF